MAAMSSDVVRHNETVLASLEEGDLVEFPRKKSSYSHWAVYVGNEEVVHMTGINEDGIQSDSIHISSICGERFPKAQIKQENFWKVAKDSMAMKNNEKDSKYSPRPKRQIVEEALKRARESLTEGYNLLYNNCEHFASWCRYQVKKSDQAESLITGASVGAVVGFAAIIGGIGLYLHNRRGRQREREDDA